MFRSSSCKSKASSSHNLSDCQDRISELPAEIIHYILSFLDASDVAKLSVLSKKWKHLWTTMPYLNFDIQKYMGEMFLCGRLFLNSSMNKNWDIDMLDQLRRSIYLILNQGSTDLIRFRLCTWGTFSYTLVTQCIGDAIRRNVQEMELQFCPGQTFKWQPDFSNCGSLKVLKLDLYDYILMMPENVRFDQLKFVELMHITFSDEDMTRRLLSGTPCLENLVLSNCYVNKTQVLDISSSSLNYLVIRAPNAAGADYGRCQIKISCPKLRYFKYEAPIAKEHTAKNLSSLEKLRIFLCPELPQFPCEEIGNRLYQILNGFENIVDVNLSATTICYLLAARRGLLSSSFDRLKSLSLSSKVSKFFILLVIDFMSHSPNLEALTINCEDEYAETDEDEDKEVQEESQTEHSELDDVHDISFGAHLKSVHLIEFEGSYWETILARFLLGLVHERMNIVCCKGCDLAEISNKVSGFPRSSSEVVVRVLDYKWGKIFLREEPDEDIGHGDWYKAADH